MQGQRQRASDLPISKFSGVLHLLAGGIVIFHIIATGSERFLQGADKHNVPLLRCGHSLDDELADTQTGSLAFSC